jgi:hypothetical protein
MEAQRYLKTPCAYSTPKSENLLEEERKNQMGQGLRLKSLFKIL